MQSLVSELSGFIMIILAALYAYIGFFSLVKKKSGELYFLEPFIIVLFHFTGFLTLYLKNSSTGMLILYLSQLLLFVFFTLVYNGFYRNFSKTLFYHMNFLILTGLIFITRLDFKAGVRQTVFAAVSLIGCLLIPFLIKKMTFLRNMGWIYAALGISTLAFVLLKAETLYGAKNWVSVFGVRFQPSEFVKILLIFMIASFLYVKKDRKQILLITVLSAVMVILLVLEKDLGGGLLYFVTFVAMMYYATKSKALLALYSGGGILAAIFSYFMFSHVRVRVTAFLDPWKDIDNKGYQVTQSLFGIGTGGWFGFGLGNGAPKQTPVVESDFIFSGISEELGLLFGFCLILIYICTFFVIILLAGKTRNEFHKMISIGCLTMYSLQAFLSVGGCVKFIPSTGVTLPLISMGGSSVMSMIIMFCVIQGLYIANSESPRRGKASFRPTRLTYVMLASYVCLLLYLTYFQFNVAAKIMNNPYNKRLDLYASTVQRGSIYSADGVLLAETKEDAEGNSIRHYPYRKLYSHIVGRNENGKTGIESLMNYELFSSNDDVLKRVSERIAGIKNRGDSVLTTIDSGLQGALDRAIGSYTGAGVILEPESGKILALVSKPDYDPNLVSSKWENLSYLKPEEAVLVNRATSGLYPPGSTFKVLTALSYLKENKDPKGFSFSCSGIFSDQGSQIQCYNKTVHGKQSLIDAFANSCNGAFAKIGLEANKEHFLSVCESLYFNKEIPFPLPTLKSGFFLTKDSGKEEVMQTSIGQGKTWITPVHNALLASVIANDGTLYRPYLVEKVVTYDGKRLVKAFRPEKEKRLISKKHSDILKEMMAAVVKKGTAKKLSGLGYPICGKTGTAEYKAESGELKSHSLFMGFGEKNGKKIALSILIEGENRGNYSGVDAAYRVFSEWGRKKNG